MADQYPQIAAGDELTAALLMSMLPRIVNKPNNTTRSSVTVPAIDPDLQMELEPNATYFVEFHLHYAAVNAEKFRTDWTVPTGATGNRCIIGMGDDGYSWTTTENIGGGTNGATDANASNNTLARFGVHGYGTDVTYGTRDHVTNQCYALETATVVTSSGGTLGLNWAQGTSGSTGTTLFATSLMRVTRLA
jgi:hypothetical protein